MANNARPVARKYDAKAIAQAELFQRLFKRAVGRGMAPEEAVRWAWEKAGMETKLTAWMADAALLAMGKGAKATIGLSRTNKEKIWRTYTPEGVALSSRVWDNLDNTRSMVFNEVRATIRAGEAVNAAAKTIHDMGALRPDMSKYLDDMVSRARRYMDAGEIGRLQSMVRFKLAQINRLAEAGNTERLRAAYKNLAETVQAQNRAAMQKAMERAVYEKTRYNARRLMQAETARAYGQGFNVRMAEDDDIIGYRSALSTSHTIYDICDFYAEADLHGLGPGGYPKDKGPPYPYHPHCQCSLYPIYRGEYELKSHEPDTDAGRRYLNSLDADERRALMGRSGETGFDLNPNQWQQWMREWEGYESKAPPLSNIELVE